ncbi:MAG TPA: superoxide dismutase family protein [Candidatus Binatia bacterium]|nr:superoxide dismutase family protein [Candidatus Binatia bacterium]
MRFPPAVIASVLFGFGANSFSVASQLIKTKFVNAKQQEVGDATVTETPNGVLIRVNLPRNPEGISPGTHAIHIHEVGSCEPPIKSAGEHFNPTHKKHGFLERQSKHAGDLPNIHVTENAPLSLEFLVPQLSLSGDKANLMDADGSAIVIHQAADDYRTDPAGDAGDRVACAVLKRSR